MADKNFRIKQGLDIGSAEVIDVNGNATFTSLTTTTINSLRYPTADGSDGQVMTTDGAGNLTFTSPGGVQLVATTTLDNPNAYDTSADDRFGWSVAIDGDYAIVGARGEDDASGTGSGKAYIFDVSTGWSLVHTLDNPNPYSTSQDDRFGSVVSISGNYAVVGATYEDDAGGTSSGKAYIYNVTTGSLVHTLDNPNAYDTSAGDLFGSAVSISGNYAIVGAQLEDDGATGSGSGKAYIFDVTTGNLLYTLDNPNAYSSSGFDYFGESVAIDAPYAIVGARMEDDASGSDAGKAYIFDVTTGSLVHTLDNPNAFVGANPADYFGFAVAISGNYAVVGAYNEDDADGLDAGKAYIFDVTTGSLVHTLDNPNPYGYGTELRNFGKSVAISGDYTVVGAPNESDVRGQSGLGGYIGKVYVFDTATGTLILTLDNPISDNFGGVRMGDARGVAVSGNYVIASSWRESDAGGTDSGKAHIFRLSPPFPFNKVADDPFPALGGDLDTNGFNINGLSYPTADGTNGQVLTTDGSGNLSFADASGGISDIVSDLTPQLGGDLDINAKAFKGKIVYKNASGTEYLSLEDGVFNSPTNTSINWYVGGESGTGQFTVDAPGGIVLGSNAGAVSIRNINYPTADGTAGQVMTTDGAGNLSFADAGGGIALTDLSVTQNAASGNGALTYTNTTGVFTYTPPDLSGYLTSYTETNDLTAAVVWANVPDVNITQSSVTQHQAALSITESQISDLQSYLTSETNTTLTADSVNQKLVYTDETGTSNDVDISWAVDDTNLARITSGTVDAATGIATFTRDDTTTFTVDFSALFDDTNLARITSATVDTNTNILTLTRSDNTTVTVDLSHLDDSGIKNVVEDTTPQLGGDLDTNGNRIFNDSGTLEFGKYGGTLTSGQDAGSTWIAFGNGTQGTGSFNVQLPNEVGSPDSLISAYGNGSVYINAFSGQNLALNAYGGGDVTIRGLAYPATDGTSGQVLTTDGAGTLSFADASGGISNVVEDLTPQLGGNLDGQAFDITTTGKILYANMYATVGDLPDASTYHGMFAHVHATGKGYFAHAGSWVELANNSDLFSGAYADLTGKPTIPAPYTDADVDTHLNTSTATTNQVLSWDGSDYAWSTAAAGGLNSVVEDTTPQLGGDLDAQFNNIINVQNLVLEESASTSNTAVFSWNNIDGTVDLAYSNGVALQLGQEQHVYGKASEAISDGDVVMFAGTQGDHILIAKADVSSATFKPEYIIGVATQDFIANDFGYVTTFGKVRGLNLDPADYADGQILYADPGVVGGLTADVPAYPYPIVQVAAILSAHQSEGTLMVRPIIMSHNDIYGDFHLYQSTETLTVTVDTKDATHPQFNNGSPSGFKINGTFSPFLHMVPGMTYRFDQSDSTNSTHPIAFYYDEQKNTAYTSGVTNNGTAGSAGAYTEITVGADTPSVLYYQCANHSLMGWGINISTHNLTGFDTDDLSEGSTNLYYTTARFNTDFGNKSTTDLTEGNNLYHTTARARGAISGTGDITYDSGTGQISFNNTSGYLTSETYSTASELLTAIKTVDGTTSGLDADLLDGQEGSHYLDYANFTSKPTSILNFGITDGTAGQVLQTDGSGNFSFTTPASGGGGVGAGYAGYEDYFFNVSSTTSTFGTASATHDKVQVFVNGVFLDDSDFSFVESTGIVTLNTAAENGDVVSIWGYNSTNLDNHELFAVDTSGNVALPGTLQIGNHRKEGSLTSTIATTSATNVVMYTSADYVGSKLIITVTDTVTGDTQITEALILTVNGGTPKVTTYGTMFTSTNALASFDVANVSTNTALEVTMASTNSSTVKVAYTLIDA